MSMGMSIRVTIGMSLGMSIGMFFRNDIGCHMSKGSWCLLGVTFGVIGAFFGGMLGVTFGALGVYLGSSLVPLDAFLGSPLVFLRPSWGHLWCS